jgi:hypothetical protein
MDRDAMIDILERLARDPDTYDNVRVTAIRTLREIHAAESKEEKPSGLEDLYSGLAVLDAKRQKKWERGHPR